MTHGWWLVANDRHNHTFRVASTCQKTIMIAKWFSLSIHALTYFSLALSASFLLGFSENTARHDLVTCVNADQVQKLVGYHVLKRCSFNCFRHRSNTCMTWKCDWANLIHEFAITISSEHSQHSRARSKRNASHQPLVDNCSHDL